MLSSQRKHVFAHFMVGNTYPYASQDWITDIQMANSNGIDGFALNVGRESWQKDRVSDCYDAASRTSTQFKLFLSFDMTSIPCSASEDANFFCAYHSSFVRHPNTFRIKGKVVISTFAGENSLFGHSTLDSAWQHVRRTLEEIAPVHFIPAFFVDPACYPRLKCMDGIFNWNGGWPTHLKVDSPQHVVRLPALDSDSEHLRHLGHKTFMAAVSPWFFTHYGPDSWNKNWIYRSDDWLLVRRWEKIFAMRERMDLVQVISWNDYGESHYIGSIKGAQPNSQAWVDSFPHEAWLRLNGYYAEAFREGRYPPIEKDEIFCWARPHPKHSMSRDSVPRPDNWQLTEDVFWVVVFAVAPAIVTLSSSPDSRDQITVEVQGGIAKLSHMLQVGGGMKVGMLRDGRVVAECNPQEYRFDGQPDAYNFNAFVAVSP